MRSFWLGVVLGLLGGVVAQAQETGPRPYSRLNTFGVFGEYSNDSSHILLGNSANRRLAGFGVSYGRRLWLRPRFELDYLAELRPVIYESDPVFVNTADITINGQTLASTTVFRLPDPCSPSVFSIVGTNSQGEPAAATFTTTCKREYTYGQGLSPLGLRFDLAPRHRVQPLLTALAGYLLTTQPIPVQRAAAFNFTFQVGAGLEVYLSRDGGAGFWANRSIEAEYRYHHISNANTGNTNPGIDSGVFEVKYAFGR